MIANMPLNDLLSQSYHKTTHKQSGKFFFPNAVHVATHEIIIIPAIQLLNETISYEKMKYKKLLNYTPQDVISHNISNFLFDVHCRKQGEYKLSWQAQHERKIR